jgi:hypothetical protein
MQASAAPLPPPIADVLLPYSPRCLPALPACPAGAWFLRRWGDSQRPFQTTGQC